MHALYQNSSYFKDHIRRNSVRMADWKVFDDHGRLHLPDDIILLLSEYLNASDCFAFSLSEVCERFAELFGQRKKLTYLACYNISPSVFYTFSDRWLAFEAVTIFDVSSCYWLPPQLISHTASKLSQLEEFYIHDTKISLFNLATIFGSCKRITKLSFSMLEDSYEDLVENLECCTSSKIEELFLNFQRLTHLKIIIVTTGYYIESWPNVLTVLGWCHNCVNLHLEISYSEVYFLYGPYGKEEWDEQVVERCHANYFPNLDWMASLKSLIILKRGFGMSSTHPDALVIAMLKWIFSEHKMQNLQRLWIQEAEACKIISKSRLTTPSIKSLLLGSQVPFELDEQPLFQSLQHLGEVGFTALSHLPEIRYIRGYCINNDGLNEFCQSHPKLEHLHLNDNNGFPFTLRSGLTLRNLKTLVYTCSYPDENIMDRLVDVCPNIQTLHLGYSNRTAIDPWTSPKRDYFMKIARFNRLNTLSFNAFHLFDGSFFSAIFAGCPELRTLHICGGIKREECVNNLCSALPLARKLSHFRLQVADFKDRTPGVFISILEALRKSQMLERLVIYEERGHFLTWDLHKHTEAIVRFAKDMRKLVAFALISPLLEDDSGRKISAEFDRLIVPRRAAFWHHMGHNPPTNSQVPKIHNDEIVGPINYYQMAPEF